MYPACVRRRLPARNTEKGWEPMDKSITELDLLEQLRKEDGKPHQHFGEVAKHLDLKAREKGVPISGKFELTPLCNFDCKMCYVHLNADQLKNSSVLPVDTWKRLMHEAWEAGMFVASLTGGECLAYPGFDELYLYLQSLGCEVHVLTNGYLLNEKRIQFFKEHKPTGIQVTLYGWNEDVYERVTGHRAFHTVMHNCKCAMEAGLRLHFSVTPSRYLGEDILETIKIAIEMGRSVAINSFYTSPREETGRSGYQDDAKTELYIRAIKYYKALLGVESAEIDEKKLPPCGGPLHEITECGLECGGGRSAFAINWQGTMTPCTDLDRIQAYPLRDGFAAAWAKVNREANSWPRVPECQGCAYENACNHCAALTLRYAEPGKKPIGLCEKTREMVRQGAWQIPACEETKA